jgi:tetratricopeptide (TPR) repeat protein
VRWAEPLTEDDIDGIGQDAIRQPDPAGLGTDLVAAVDQGHLATPDLAGYALLIAAEIRQRAGELEEALTLAARAVDECRKHDDHSLLSAQAYYAQLLAERGRAAEATAAFEALRPQLVRTPGAAATLSDAMEAAGRGAEFEQWLTAALTSVLDRPEGREPDVAKAELVIGLVQTRHRLRHELGLPHDEYDNLADRLNESVEDEAEVLAFWPRAEFDRMLLRWPALAETYGKTWDDHRAMLERALVAEPGSGLGLFAASAEGLADFARRRGADPAGLADPLILGEYAETHVAEIAWPPGRNEACWCGSGAKYKKCCLPRSRG